MTGGGCRPALDTAQRYVRTTRRAVQIPGLNQTVPDSATPRASR
jgi:hypothetical protein